MPTKTRDVQQLLGVGYNVLANLLRTGKVRPRKDASGDYIWGTEDIEAVQSVIQSRRKPVAA